MKKILFSLVLLLTIIITPSFLSAIEIPAGYDFSNFDMSNIPAGFDMSNIPEGFDMSSMMNEEFQKGMEEAKQLQEQIRRDCEDNPLTCSCESISCEKILEIDSPQAQEGYNTCIQAKQECEEQRQEGIAQMEKEKSEIKSKIEAQCREDFNKCDCSSISNEEGKKECELAIIEARYQAEKQKTDKIKECSENIDSCNCSDIENEDGKKECELKLSEAKVLKERVEKNCRENLASCDCSEIEQADGKVECERNKQQALDEASSMIKDALSKCFKDVEKCVCSELDLPKDSDVEFCEIQKSYGLSCKHDGLNCDKLENVDIFPAGMPPFLGKFFAQTYDSFVNKEKEKGAKEASKIITQCLKNPEECRCEETPSYAQAFCEKNKALQIKCEAGDYDACIVLDETPNLPEGMPAFSVNILDNLVGSLRNAQKSLIQGNAARKVGAMILECMDDASKCDCSLAPAGSIKSFCLHKQELVKQCREEKNYPACFNLDEETIVPVGTPNIIANFITGNTLPKVNEKKQIIFDQMKIGTECEQAKTIQDCKLNYYEK